jgi:hypothetical protein
MTSEFIPAEPDSAAGRRDQIKSTLHTMIDFKESFLDLITEAYENHDHIALGFKSWTDYLRTEYGGLLTRLTVEDRRETVLILSRTGMSTRAISPVVGVDNATVHRDLAGVAFATPADEPADDHEIPLHLIDEIADKIRDDPTPERTVVGIDGKRYRAPKPKTKTKPGQKATPGAFWDAAYEFQKKLTTLENVVKRASFPRNRKVIRDKHLGDLIRQSNRLKAVISALSDPVDGDDPR